MQHGRVKRMGRHGLRAALALGLSLSAACLSFQTKPLNHRPDEPGIFQFVEVDGVKLHLRDSAAASDTQLRPGPEDQPSDAVLMIHGYASSLATWAANFDSLASQQRVIAVDLKGFGESDKPSGDYRPIDQATLLVHLLDKLGLRKVHVVAHSWGASVALALALNFPERVDRLVLMSAWVYDAQLPMFFRLARVPGVGEALFAMYYREQPNLRIGGAFYDKSLVSEALIEAIEAAYQRPGAVAAAHATAKGQVFRDMQQHYPELQNETLLIWGREDHTSGVEVGEKLEATLANAQLMVLPRCGHLPMIERAATVNRALINFFAPATTSAEPKPIETKPSASLPSRAVPAHTETPESAQPASAQIPGGQP